MSFTLQNLVWTWSIVVLRRKILRRLPIWRVQNIIYWGSLDDHHGGIWSSESGKKWDFSVLLFLVLARKAYNLKRNFCSLGVVPVFASFFLPLIVNTNKKMNKYDRLVYFFLNDQYFQTTMNYGLPEARSLF